jgi:hypothetical protein
MPDATPSHPDMQAIAKQVMTQRGFKPDFAPEVPQQLAEIKAHPPTVAPGGDIRDLPSTMTLRVIWIRSRSPIANPTATSR